MKQKLSFFNINILQCDIYISYLYCVHSHVDSQRRRSSVKLDIQWSLIHLTKRQNISKKKCSKVYKQPLCINK